VVATFNRSAERIFGWPSTEIIGQWVGVLLAPESGDDESDGRDERHRAAGVHPVRAGAREVVAKRRDGSEFPMYLTCSESPTPEHGLVTAIARDLTEHRQNSEALQLANALLEIKVIELEERTRVITLLGQMSDVLQTAVAPSDAYACVADYAEQLFSLDAGALCTVSPASNTVEVVASWGAPATRSVFVPRDCFALRTGRSHGAHGHGTEQNCPHVLGDLAAGHACIPITSHAERIGILCVRWHPKSAEAGHVAAVDAPFRAKLAAAFAEQVGMALTSIRLKEELRSQAIHDPLTGLHNRRFLEDAFRRELLRAARKRSPVGVLMLDLDHFKAFNDAHGHGAGDALLRAFAVQLRSDIRAEDIACRYGGEEFVVILPDTTSDEALERAEQVRVGLSHLVVDFRGQALASVTVSIGVATAPEHGDAPDPLLRAADAALYAAKAGGRNRTRAAGRMRESFGSQLDFGTWTGERLSSGMGGHRSPSSVKLKQS
jgi:diguanylate cyclase (GGDEF)-like protein/PAS domain S-box-containing protein